MNSKNLQRLQYFVGKVCSIFTPQINRSFDEARSREHFVIRVQEINAEGVWGSHPYNGSISYFSLPHILLIQEEIELDPKNPEHARMIKEYEQKTGKKIASDVSPHLTPKVPSGFVDISALESMTGLTK